MKLKRIRTSKPVMSLLVVLVLGLPAWTTCSAQQNPPPSKAVTEKENFSQQKKKYQKEMRADLKRLRQEIADLRAKAPENSDELQKDFDKQMADLERKRDVAEQKLAKLEKSSQKAWQDMKPGVDAALKDLEDAYKRASSDFK